MIREKIDNGMKIVFGPTPRSVSLFGVNDEPITRAGFDEWGLTFPMRVVLDITSVCNCRCRYCSYGINAGTKGSVSIPKERFFALIDELEEMKVFEFSLRGGEPTTHPDFKEIWYYAQSKLFLTTNVVTNGLLLSEAKIRLLLSANLSARIIVSLDGFAETNTIYRDPRQYEYVMSWLPNMLRDFPYQIAVITCLYRESGKRVVEFSRSFASLGLKLHDFSPLRRLGDAAFFADEKFLSLSETKNIQEELDVIKKDFPDFRPIITAGKIHEARYPVLVNFPVPLFNELHRGTMARINELGDVWVSARKTLTDLSFPLGNIFKHTLREIWVSSRDTRRQQAERYYRETPSVLLWDG